MIWNFDISSAPRGRHETRVRTVKAEKQEYDVFIPERVLIAHPRDGLVYASYWIEPNKFCTKGRWAGWREGDEPLAWQPYPEHPNQVSDGGAFAAVKGKARLADHTKVEPSLSDRQYLEKIADQVIARNSKTDAAISRPGKPRPEIENRSGEEPCQARGSGEMQDEDAIHLPTFSKAETSREASPAAETVKASRGQMHLKSSAPH